VAVAGSLLLAIQLTGSPAARRTRRTAFSFILILLASQLFIFGFTSKGLWAESYTAINRLPLQFVPALLFVVMVVAHASLTNGEAQPKARNETA